MLISNVPPCEDFNNPSTSAALRLFLLLTVKVLNSSETFIGVVRFIASSLKNEENAIFYFNTFIILD